MKNVRRDAVVYLHLRNSVTGYQLFQVSQEHIRNIDFINHFSTEHFFRIQLESLSIIPTLFP